MGAALVIALSQVPTSGAASAQSLSAASRAQDLTLRVSAPEHCQSARRGLAFYRGRHADWLKLRGAKAQQPVRAPRNCADARWLASVAQKRSFAARQAYERWQRVRRNRYRDLYEKYRCIHEHEGAWNSNTGNGYWGGLQMDWGFMHTYGPEFIRRWGLAHRWPVWAQLEAAERAFHGFAGFAGRGYSPWGTRGMCGV